jgi:catechol 2,3-dioxygenase-like lactoylglutathione lyase family enzyme
MVKARVFFEDRLGLRLASDETPFALVFDAGGIMLRLTPVAEHKPQPFTVLGWAVESIESTVDQLTAAGVEFMRFPGLNDSGPRPIWNAPSGARVAWFHDPDKNVLSLTQFWASKKKPTSQSTRASCFSLHLQVEPKADGPTAGG